MAGLVAGLAGCGTLFRNPVPLELMNTATVPDMPNVRAPAGRPSAAMGRDLEESFGEERPGDFPRGADGLVHYPHLALSGGGANGAFGAGFLNGWSATGRRPLFKIVTGVSTGALMAPFAFLGATHDADLRDFYTTTASRDIFIIGSMFSILQQLLFGDAIASSQPLEALIAQHVDDAFLAKIAQAHRDGRRLYIGTADLDSQRFIIWNMGLIANSGSPAARDLFRKVMLASASIPVAFPPVFFEVEANGQRYDEMHVDGGVGANVFFNGGLFSIGALRERAGRGGGSEDIFVIHNGQLVSVPSITRRSLPGIAMRTIDSVAKSASVGDLFRIFALAQIEQASFNWITIPDGVTLKGSETFDPVQMNKLYQIGYAQALAGPVWMTRPPGVLERGAILTDGDQ